MKYNNYLVVILHGYVGSPLAMSHVKRHVENHFPGAVILVPQLPMGFFSRTDPEQIARSIVETINEAWSNSKTTFDKILLIGHSCGALLARKVYVLACGENPDAPFERLTELTRPPSKWAAKVDRIILLAGMNRGSSISPHLSYKEAVVIRILAAFGNLLVALHFTPMIFRFKKGAPFITQLRLQWLSLLQHADQKGYGKVPVIQLLGTIDDLVSPDDNLDLVTGSSFYYPDVPLTGHADVIKMDDSEVGMKRASVFESALLFTDEQLSQHQVYSWEQQPVKQNFEVTDVVFVIHGIRDAGFWTKKVAREIQKLAIVQQKVFETETSSYGYFPMLPFLLLSTRRAKVEWLMDQYTENKAMFPAAKFSYVGHSNGTYLLARALTAYASCKFENVVFAGSVVRSDFDWKSLISEGRVKQVLNYVATQDWVVAIFPKTFQVLGIQDLGSAGHDGFDAPAQQIRYIKGGHGAGVAEGLWGDIAAFIVNGKVNVPPLLLKGDVQSPVVRVLGRAAPLAFAFGIAIVVGLGWSIWAGLDEFPVKRVILLVFYIFVIWKGLTKL